MVNELNISNEISSTNLIKYEKEILDINKFFNDTIQSHNKVMTEKENTNKQMIYEIVKSKDQMIVNHDKIYNEFENKFKQ